MDFTEGKELDDCPNSVSLGGTEILLDQMKNMLCKVFINDEFRGTGFFAKIQYIEGLFPALITNNHVIDESFLDNEKELKISMNNRFKKIELDERNIYTDKNLDVTIIEIKERDGINKFIDIEDNIMDKNNLSYINRSVYALYIPENKNAEVSFGIIKEEENEYNFNHLCKTGKYSSGPILNISNNKLIGMHKGGNKNKKVNLGLFLKYAIKGLIDENKKLFEFNQKYCLDIKNKNITKLDLYGEFIGNEGLKELCELELKELKELNLCGNSLTDISYLIKAKFEKLEKLNLQSNSISNDILEKVNFKELKELKIDYNSRTQFLWFLEKVNFPKLENLYINMGDPIGDKTQIKVLENVNFKELKELNINGFINDNTFLDNINFEKLEKLYLYFSIPDVKFLERETFQNLKELYLGAKDISSLENLNFAKLEKLNISSNDINVLESVNFPNLKELYLGVGKTGISVLEKVKFENLEILDISSYKNILDMNILEKVNFKKLKYLKVNCSIPDLKFLEKVKFDNLLKLILYDILTTNISGIEKANFKELKEIRLGSFIYNFGSSQKIFDDLSPLSEVKFKHLEILYLNKISNCNFLEKLDFKDLKELSIRDISDIKILEKVKFEKLEKIYLGSHISDLTILEKVNFKGLKELSLSCNEISDINILEKVKFEKLEILNLTGNKISEINIF